MNQPWGKKTFDKLKELIKAHNEWKYFPGFVEYLKKNKKHKSSPSMITMLPRQLAKFSRNRVEDKSEERMQSQELKLWL